MNYNSVGGAVSIPLVTLFMFNRLICWRMWSVLSRGPAEAARLVNCSISRLFSLNRPQTSSWNCQAPGPGSGDGQGLNLVITGQSLLKTGPGLYTIIKKSTTYPHPNAPHTLTISTETFISAITNYHLQY